MSSVVIICHDITTLTYYIDFSLVPIILLMNSDQAFDDEDVKINASTYLSEFITITAASTSDGEYNIPGVYAAYEYSC